MPLVYSIMDSVDVIDEVNALLKLRVGDSYRLEHIKQAYIQNKSIWVTDENYLKRMREKYLVKHTPDVSGDIVFENEPKDKEIIHCWKCGKKGPMGANFCMVCGTSIFEVDATPQRIPKLKSIGSRRSIPLKIPILIGIPILILIILGAGYTMGYFDNFLNSSSRVVTTPTDVIIDDGASVDSNSACGPGTVYDSESNSCMLGTTSKTDSSADSNSACGPGTVYDSESNSCILDSR